jgi:hypothetical protein
MEFNTSEQVISVYLKNKPVVKNEFFMFIGFKKITPLHNYLDTSEIPKLKDLFATMVTGQFIGLIMARNVGHLNCACSTFNKQRCRKEWEI